MTKTERTERTKRTIKQKKTRKKTVKKNEQKTEDKKKRKFTQLLLKIKRTKREIKKANCVTKEEISEKVKKV